MSAWISVDERLPELKTPVLVHLPEGVKDKSLGDVFTALRLDEPHEWWCFGSHCGGTLPIKAVTKWMPIPKVTA